jgi:hypothetical protein
MMKLKLLVILLLFSAPAISTPRPLADLFVQADPQTGLVSARVAVVLSYPGRAEYKLQVSITDMSGAQLTAREESVQVMSGRADVTTDLSVPDHQAWSPEQPTLYRARLRLVDFRGLTVDQREVRFGFRRVERRGNRLFLNDHPLFLRGFAGEFLASGDHGCMSSDREYIRKRILTAKEYGFNAERHHTHFPTEIYLEMADELGLLQQLEIHGRMRQGPDSKEFAETRALWEELVRLSRQHPSVIIVSMGNEVYSNDPKLVAAMDQLYSVAKKLNPGVLVLNRSGGLPGNDLVGKYDLVERPIGEYEHSGNLAGEAFESYLRGERAGRAREFPVIAHEYPLVSAYPRLEKSSLYPRVPEWFAAAAENAQRGGYLDEMPRFARNCEAIQWRVIKQMIEEARKFPELSGYSMLRLHDTGAMVGGILDDFSNPKSISAREFLRVNGPTVLLASWAGQTFRSEDHLEVRLHVSQHLDKPLQGNLDWRLVSPDGEWGKGTGSVLLDGFGTFDVATVSLSLPKVTRPAHFKLEAALKVDGREPITNDWDFWIFPRIERSREEFKLFDPHDRLRSIKRMFPRARTINSPAQLDPRRDTLVTDSWPGWVDGFLDRGGRLLLISDKNWAEPEELGNHGNHLAFFKTRAPVALPELDEPLTHWLTIPSNYPRRWGNSGTVVERHPALGDFPHEGFCDFQFLKLIRRAKSFWLDRLPARPRPIIRAIDNFWHGNNKAYLVEFRVGQGRVLATTLNFTQHLGRAPEADYLLNQFIRYVKGPEFSPRTAFSAAQLRTSIEQFARALPELIKQIGDANAPPTKYRYHPLSGEMN